MLSLSETPQPSFEATISPGLIAALRGEVVTPGADREGAVPEPERLVGDQAQAPVLPAVAAQEGPYERIVLRQDGAYPLVFEGALLWQGGRVAQGEAGGRVSLQVRLFAAQDGRVAVHCAVEPDGVEAARPVHRAGFVGSQDALGDVLADCTFDACFKAAPHQAQHHSEICAQLAADWPVFSAPLLLPGRTTTRET